MARKMLLSIVVSSFVLSILILACRSDRDTKAFTEDEVRQVEAVLKEVRPDTYRIILPEFRDGKVVGSKTYGSLPVTQVRRVASQRNIAFSDSGNVQAVFSPDGGGPGSHTESQS